MKTVGKTLILLGLGLPILALLNCIGWEIYPTGSFLSKIRASYVELRPETKTPDIVHRESDSFSNAFKTIESTALEKYPPAIETNSSVDQKPVGLLNVDFGPADQNEIERNAFIRNSLVEQGLLTPERTYAALRVRVGSVFVFSLLMILVGVFFVWK